MISFRYHLVSLVAAFLALAVGIVIGSTLADRAIVDGLRSRVDTVSANLDERQAANDRLRAANDRLAGYLTEGSARLVADELDGRPVVVVAEQGVDGGVVDRTLGLLVESGAQVRARVDVRSEWALDDASTRIELASALDIERGDGPEMRARLARLLVADLVSTVVVPDDGVGPIDAATRLDLLDYDAIDDRPLDSGQTVAFVVVTGTASSVDTAATDLAQALAAAGAPTVVASAFDESADDAEETDRAERLAPILTDSPVGDAVATVDHLDLPQGPLTLVLALADAVDGVVGHYGYGADTDGVVPEPAPA